MMARCDRRWQCYHLARSAALWPSDGMLEVWIEAQINTLSVFSADRPPLPQAAAMFSILTPPRLPSQRESNLAKARRTTEGGHVLLSSLSTFPHLFYSLVFFSSIVLIPHPCGLFSPTPLSPSHFFPLCPSFSPLESSFLQENKVSQAGPWTQKTNLTHWGESPFN